MPKDASERPGDAEGSAEERVAGRALALGPLNTRNLAVVQVAASERRAPPPPPLRPSLMYPLSGLACVPAIARFCCANARFAFTSAERSFGAVLPPPPTDDRPPLAVNPRWGTPEP